MRIILADDHGIVRQGFRLILSQQPDIQVVGEASTGKQAVDLAVALEPDNRDPRYCHDGHQRSGGNQAHPSELSARGGPHPEHAQ